MTLTKTKTMFLFGALSVALMLPFSLVEMEENSIPFAEATPQNERAAQNTPNEKTRNMEEPPAWGLASEALDFDFEVNFDFDVPSRISENAVNGHKIAVAKNSQVKELLGDDYEYTNYHQYGTDYGWQPVLHYLTDNGKYTVTVTMDKGKVVDVVKYKTIKFGVPDQGHSKGTDLTGTVLTETFTSGDSRAYAIDQYSDDRYDVTGMAIYVKVPDYTYNTGNFTALLLNAVKPGSIGADLCDESKFPASYWGQVGIDFDENGARLVYTDTTFECKAKIFPHIEYKTGDRIVFVIFINDATDEWFLYANNQDDSNLAVAWVMDVPGSSLFDIDTPNTSVFFENSNHESDGDWQSGFASDLVVDAAIWQYTNSYWYVWFDENQIPWNCEAETLGSELMNGTFVGYPYDVTFDVSEIQEKCPAP